MPGLEKLFLVLCFNSEVLNGCKFVLYRSEKMFFVVIALKCFKNGRLDDILPKLVQKIIQSRGKNLGREEGLRHCFPWRRNGAKPSGSLGRSILAVTTDGNQRSGEKICGKKIRSRRYNINPVDLDVRCSV